MTGAETPTLGRKNFSGKALFFDLLRRAEEVEKGWRPRAVRAGGGREVQAVGGDARRERERAIPQAAIVGGAQQVGEFRHGGVVDVAHLFRFCTLAEQRAGFVGCFEIMGGALFG